MGVRMMKFSELKYERPDYEALKNEFNQLMMQFEAASSAKEQIEIIYRISEIRGMIETMEVLAADRHAINVKDEFYEVETEYWDEQEAIYETLFEPYIKAVVESAFRPELEESLGKLFFYNLDCQIKAFSPEIVEDLQVESKLQSEYEQIMAEAMVTFKGEEMTIDDLYAFMEDRDRNTRRAANDAYYQLLVALEAQLDDIFDQLIKVRTRMARKLGFENFTELGYLRMKRSYCPEAVGKFREQVVRYIVPVAASIAEDQKMRLGYGELRYFDRGLKFLTGNATPKGSPEWILEQGAKMYHEMAPEVAELYEFMVEGELLDVLNRPNKGSGGFASYYVQYQRPFIFANFNSTAADIDVLTHEMGHAFQGHESRHIKVYDLIEPTYDLAEVHATSMEFLTWPWMENFFKEDTKKYKYTHLSGNVAGICYIVAIDEYQHLIYENPEWTPKERKAAWLEVEKKYQPYLDNRGCDFLERGNGWNGNGDPHIFTDPFYYIDYALATICALQFWKKMQDDQEGTWNDFVRICQVGGTMSFSELVEYGNLISPFEDGCVSGIITEIKDWLEHNKDVEVKVVTVHTLSETNKRTTSESI